MNDVPDGSDNIEHSTEDPPGEYVDVLNSLDVARGGD